MSLRDVDECVLDWAQRRSDWLQVWTGLDCIQQARALAIPIVAACLYYVIDQQLEPHRFDWIAGFCLLAQIHRAFFEQEDDNLARHVGVRNPRRWNPILRGCRLILMVLQVAWIFGVHVWAVIISLVWIQTTLEACDVQPPSTPAWMFWRQQRRASA